MKSSHSSPACLVHPRGVVLATATIVALAVSGTPARAQWGNWGWGGWGSGGGASTVQGNVAQGLGALAVGVGEGRQQTAVARSVNADTVMRWNEYMYLSQQEANRRYQERLIQTSKDRNKARVEINRRLRDNPTPSDINKGDALNVALDEINNPRVYSRSLKAARTKVPGARIRDIPFQKAAAAITTSVEQIIREGPPAVLKTDTFAGEREALKPLGAELRAQIEQEGKPDPSTLRKVQDVLVRVRGKVEATIPKNTRERREAEAYLKPLYGLMRMLQTPAIDVLLAGVENRPETTLGDLVGFMQAFNLRFGVARTPRQQDVYRELYPSLVALRDEAAQAVKGAAAPAPPRALPPGEVLESLELDQLDLTKNPASPE